MSNQNPSIKEKKKAFSMKTLQRLSLPMIWGTGVGLPFAVVVIYLVFFAAPQYQTEAQFIVKRNGTEHTALSLGIPLLGQNSSTSYEDARILADYIISSNMLSLLQKELDVMSNYQAPKLDFWAHLDEKPSKERFLAYYQKMISVEINPDSSVVTVKARAFSPEMADAICSQILKLSEIFINGISENLAVAQMGFIKNEVLRAEEGLKKASLMTLQFQRKYSLLNPESEGASLFGIISSIEFKISEKEAELKMLKSYLREDAPQVAKVKKEIGALRAQVAEETNMLAGDEGRSLNQIIAEYQELKIAQEFALNAYTSTLASFESAQTDAARQIKFLVPISTTGVADISSYPKPFKALLTTFIVAAIIVALFRLIIATIKDHLS